MAKSKPIHRPYKPQPPGHWAKYAKTKRAKRLAAGLCGSCGQAPFEAGKFTCTACLKKLSERNVNLNPEQRRERSLAAKERRQTRAATGLCTDCGKSPPAHKSNRCLECLIKDRAKGHRLRATRKKPSAEWMQAFKRQWRAKRKASGVCTTCGGERDVPGRVRCADCHAKDGTASRMKRRTQGDKLNDPLRTKRKQWEADGKCNWCGDERDRLNRKRCATCRKKGGKTLKTIARKRRAMGLCPGCGGTLEAPLKYAKCERCRTYSRNYYRREYVTDPDKVRARFQLRRYRVHYNGGNLTAVEWKAIKAFVDFHCLKCGQREPEISLQTDHIFPVADGGRHSADNVQPLCERCNKQKGKRHADYRSQELIEFQKTLPSSQD